jgi:choline dehydrogenase-like flavoprotein
LSAKRDALGVPIARVDWHIGDEERTTLLKLSRMIASEFPNIGLPAPDMEAWVKSGDVDKAAIIDMGHTSGTTRMASDPSEGVVDLNCQVHGVQGLYIGGSSVFPTSGHANPTLMAVTLAVRLADYIKKLVGATA